MDLAIVGAAGSCGRQLASQLLDSRVLPPSARLQLVGHAGGLSERELWGLRADLEDAFADSAPEIELIWKPEDVDADVVVMLAGATVSLDPDAPIDRAALGRTNQAIFRHYADALGKSDRKPIVIVQSNPVELGVEIFAEACGRNRVLGAGARSDTIRLRTELAQEFGVPRPAVQGLVMGQHGDYMVPAWSQLHVRGVEADRIAEVVGKIREGRALTDFPDEIRDAKVRLIEQIREKHVSDAYEFVMSLPADLRAAVKPFFTHFTAGRTTEVVTARSVVDFVVAFAEGRRLGIAAQVCLEGEWDGLTGVTGALVLLSPEGWSDVVPIELADDEQEALRNAMKQIEAANRALG